MTPYNYQVIVRDDNIDASIKKLKKLTLEMLREVRERQLGFVKPSIIRHRYILKKKAEFRNNN